MVVLNRIYTRGGDGGETSLGDGSRVKKYAARVEAYGAVDETNSVLGLARLHADGDMNAALQRIQNDLFDLGADLCVPLGDEATESSGSRLRIVASQTLRLETEIDGMNAELAPLRSFVLPGGSVLSSHLHVCRTACRRAERLTVALSDSEPVNGEAVKYLNRLSDWLFVASRAANASCGGDVLWVPGGAR